MRDFDPTAGEFAGHDAIRRVRYYDMGSIVNAGASLLGSAMSSDAAGDAAATQAAATREANQVAREQNQQVRSDLTPYRNLGSGATNLLAQYLGISMPSQPSGASAATPEDRAAVRNRLLSQFTRTSGGGEPQYGQGEESNHVIGYSAPTSSVDEAGLNAAIDAELANMYPAAVPQAGGASGADFGSLLRNFTGQDLQNEPGYQFGLAEGQKGIDRRAASGGNYFSGGALKAAARFGNDYASTKFGDAFNRDAANKTRIYNFLTGAVGTGQNAAAQTGNAGSAMAQQVGANTTALGNAQGAAQIAQGNAWSSGLQNISNTYNQNELMNKILGGNTGFGYGGGESWRTSGNGMPAGYRG